MRKLQLKTIIHKSKGVTEFFPIVFCHPFFEIPLVI